MSFLGDLCVLCRTKAIPLSTGVRTQLPGMGLTTSKYAYCDSCDFAFCMNPVNEGVLADYYSSTTRYRRGGLTVEEARHIAQQVAFASDGQALAGTDVLEVGPDTGEFLAFLCQHAKAFGHFREHNIEARRSLEQAGFLQDAGQTYDLIVMRHVLEHIVDPATYLSAIPLAKGGSLFVEVPDYTDLMTGLSDPFQFEHVNYFTLRSLDKLARVSNLSISRAEIIRTPGYSTTPNRVLRAILTASTGVQQGLVEWERFASERLDDYRRVHELIAERPTVLYGAGARTLDYFAEFGVHSNVVAVYDADPAKVGTEVYGHVVRCASEITSEHRVVVMVVGYRREVTAFLSARGIVDCVHLTREE